MTNPQSLRPSRVPRGGAIGRRPVGGAAALTPRHATRVQTGWYVAEDVSLVCRASPESAASAPAAPSGARLSGLSCRRRPSTRRQAVLPRLVDRRFDRQPSSRPAELRCESDLPRPYRHDGGRSSTKRLMLTPFERLRGLDEGPGRPEIGGPPGPPRGDTLIPMHGYRPPRRVGHAFKWSFISKRNCGPTNAEQVLEGFEAGPALVQFRLCLTGNYMSPGLVRAP